MSLALIQVDCDTGGHPADSGDHHLNMSALPNISRITMRDVRGTASMIVAKLEGLQLAPISAITLERLHFDGGEYKCSNVSGTYHDVVPTPCDALSPQEQTAPTGAR